MKRFEKLKETKGVGVLIVVSCPSLPRGKGMRTGLGPRPRPRRRFEEINLENEEV